MSEPGWHPDPAGRHQWRFWDGRQWTDRVADGQVVGTDPLPPAPTEPRQAADEAAGAPGREAEQVVVDTSVGAGLRGQRRLVVTDRALYDGDRTYRFERLTSLAHLATTVKGSSGGVMNVSYDLWLGFGGKPQRIYWTGRGPHERQVFDAVVEALHRFAGPRLVAGLVQRVRAGDTVEVGGMRFTATGLERRRALGGLAAVTWAEVEDITAEAGHLAVTVRTDEGSEKRFASVSLKEPNAPLIPALVRALGG